MEMLSGRLLDAFKPQTGYCIALYADSVALVNAFCLSPLSALSNSTDYMFRIMDEVEADAVLAREKWGGCREAHRQLDDGCLGWRHICRHSENYQIRDYTQLISRKAAALRKHRITGWLRPVTPSPLGSATGRRQSPLLAGTRLGAPATR
jgi:hypothetical protein